MKSGVNKPRASDHTDDWTLYYCLGLLSELASCDSFVRLQSWGILPEVLSSDAYVRFSVCFTNKINLVSCYVMSCYVMSFYVMLCYVMSCYHVMLCHFMLCYVMLLCYIMSCHVMAPNICGSLVWNLLQVMFLTPRILRWLVDFWKFVHPWYVCMVCM
jgi:hypothetical protein